MDFKLESKFKPRGDQPRAIKKLSKNIESGKKDQVLLGVTGSGKTFTISNLIENVEKPTLVISHNKTLAAQLFQEFRDFFPQNAVHYFVSYYDYYQPEAYIPTTDTYIEKDASINESIDRLRHGASQAVLSRNDTIVVASVSCIYGIGQAEEYQNVALELKKGDKITKRELIENLVDLQYSRNQSVLDRSTFRRRADTIEIVPAFTNEIIQVKIKEQEIISIVRQNSPLLEKKMPFEDTPKDKKTTKEKREVKRVKIWPAKHYVTPKEKLKLAIKNIKAELKNQVEKLKKQGKDLEAQRLKQKTKRDLEMLRETGHCKGIENYSRHLSFREPGEPPQTLVDYFRHSFGEDWLLVIDESHMSIPQIRGMYEGDRSRKENLIEHGFRLPSARDNRPLKFPEFEKRMPQTIYMSATPGDYELKKASRGEIKSLAHFEKRARQKTKKLVSENKKASEAKNIEKFYLDQEGIVEQLIRPTGLLDPKVEIRPRENQIDNLIAAIKKNTNKEQRTLVTTITQDLAENISNYLKEEGIKALWLHAEIPTLERPDILKKLRKGKIDVIVGINLLREGLDLPEVSLVAILDADKEGFLRNETTLIQTMGRAARHPEGQAILYAQKETTSIKNAVFETKRRRKIQATYNKIHNITPEKIERPIRENIIPGHQAEKGNQQEPTFKDKAIDDLKEEMKQASDNLNFEKAAKLRDRIEELENEEDS
jgi:excinuclease ABC subunit B